MDHLTTEQQNPDSSRLDEMSALEIVTLINGNDATVAAAVTTQLTSIARSIELIARQLRDGGRLFYIGAGTSGRLGVLDASECPPTFRTPPEMVVGIIAGGQPALTRAIEGAEDDPSRGSADLASHNFSAKDVLVGIATSGRTPYVLGAMQHARQTGATVIGLACNEGSELQQYADSMITVVVGPEIISGSTRLKAGTATKLVLNMLSTGAMVLLGKTYGNLMVDLRATNAKLMDRSIRIVRKLTGVSAETARDQLNDCDGSVKLAVIAIRGNINYMRAGELLDHAEGRLRVVLSRFETSPVQPNEEASLLFVGVDGGGTRTTAVLGRFSDLADVLTLQVLGQGTSGPGNPTTAGLTTATLNIVSAIRLAFADARLKPCKVAGACFGLAGTGEMEIRNSIAALLRNQALADHVLVTDDIRPVLESARHEYRKEPGITSPVFIALIAGTGSIAAAQTADGSIIRSGGWGPLLGDEGSGYAIAMSGLRAACRAADGRAAPTAMLDAFLKQIRLAEPEQLKSWIHASTTTRSTIAACANIVFECSATDSTACEVIDHAAVDLAGLIVPLVRKTCQDNDWTLAISGGLLTGQPILQQKLLEQLGRQSCRPASTGAVCVPAIGAIIMALSQTDVEHE